MKPQHPFWYLATPYSRYPRGPDMAAKHAAQIAAFLIGGGVRVFCPITHSHPIAVEGKLPCATPRLWLWLDEGLMEAATGLIVAEMEGWETSVGMTHEIAAFARDAKPVLYLDQADCRRIIEGEI